VYSINGEASDATKYSPSPTPIAKGEPKRAAIISFGFLYPSHISHTHQLLGLMQFEQPSLTLLFYFFVHLQSDLPKLPYLYRKQTYTLLTATLFLTAHNFQ